MRFAITKTIKSAQRATLSNKHRPLIEKRTKKAFSNTSQRSNTGVNGYKSITFKPSELQGLTNPIQNLVTSCPKKMVQHRSDYLDHMLATPSEDGRPGHFNFLGTDTGLSAISVIIGGEGRVGPYAGGWQGNAQSSRRLSQFGSKPDLLHVAPEEPGNLAGEFNGFIRQSALIQQVNENKLTQNLDKRTPKEQEKILNEIKNQHINFEDTAILADLEQGFRNFQKTADAVYWAIQNGATVLHIEDQGRNKRCGHLGGKELASTTDYCDTLRAANFSAQSTLGPEQAERQWVKFVARTDAYSADRIEFSNNLKDPSHPDHAFIDWDKGFSPDGQYVYLKKGTNPETGNTFGLDLSIARSVKVINEGLAPFVWMETTTGDLHTVKAFIEGVNKKLEPFDKKGRYLWNHSPSFEWDIQTYSGAIKLGKMVAEFIKQKIAPEFEKSITKPQAITALKEFIATKGDHVLGDTYTDDRLNEILGNGLDYARGAETWNEELTEIEQAAQKQPFGLQTYRIEKLIDKVRTRQYRPDHHIINCIVGQRLENYEAKLQELGVELNLCTLPEWHAKTFGMTKLARAFKTEGIHAFVEQQQRPGRKEKELGLHPLYGHQTWSGVPPEVLLNQTMGSSDTEILSGSTEALDRKTASKLQHK